MSFQASLSPAQPSSSANDLSPSAASMLRVLLPSLTKIDNMLESVWSKQDDLNQVLDRLTTELEQFDELVLPASAETDTSLPSNSISSSKGVEASQKLKDSRTRIANVNATLKRVRARLDNVAMLAQAKVLQNQNQSQSQQQQRDSLN
ncbi:hypothetical protein LPJ66_002812 [Kickxella alabastrina]|uniref:Uncharacterized protein n=1 Tax=Kickxella alabastrina TaxID=61397 RepID=A0ACC1IPE8_9FUNG|nr:hypothetical protein LPJ66_002812 [Kickxella alabastrina]